MYSAWEKRNKKAGRYGIKGGKGSTFVVPRNEDHRCRDVTVAENEETRISRTYKTIRGSTLIRVLLPTSMAVERKEKRGNSKKKKEKKTRCRALRVYHRASSFFSFVANIPMAKTTRFTSIL